MNFLQEIKKKIAIFDEVGKIVFSGCDRRILQISTGLIDAYMVSGTMRLV